MNTKRTTMGWLVLAAALMIGMTACSKEENLTEEPTTAAGVQVTVSAGMDDGAMTRADVTEAVVEGKTQRTLKFTAGDRLYIWRYKDGYLNGILTMDGEPTADGLGATFSGTLKAYDNYGIEITNYDYSSLGSDPLTGSEAILIPSGAASGCFNEASHTGALFKENYSIAADVNTLMTTALYVTGAYNGSGYTLTKQKPILNCNLGGLTAGTTYSVTLGFTADQSRYEYSGIDIFSFVYTPTIIADGDGNVRFAISVEHDILGHNLYWVLRLHAGMFNYDYIIGQKQFEAKVYNVTRATPNATGGAAVGLVIGSDGKNYDYASLPSGVTAVAKICYVSGNHLLALALTDEGQMNWSTAITTCAAHTPTIPGGTWKLASQDEWNQMISAAGGYEALRDGFESVGGTNMQSAAYWSSTEGPANTFAYRYIFSNGDWQIGMKSQDGVNVRACLAF